MKTRTFISIGFMSLFVIFLMSLVSAQVPQPLNYQGKLVKTDGKAEEGTFAMVFSIYSTETGGTALWSETQTTVTVLRGIFNVLLNVQGSIFAGSGDRFLGIKVGDGAEMTPRFRLTSVPYAQRASEADGVKDGSITTSKIANGAITQDKLASSLTDGDWTISGNNIYSAVSGNVGVGTSNPTQKLDVSGTIQMSSFKMPNGAVNGYVLTSDANGVGTWKTASGGISGSGSSNYIPKFTGSTSIGNSVIYQSAAGYTGIGTTSPQGKLHVSHDNLNAGYFTSSYLNNNTHIIHSEYNGSAGNFNPIAVYGRSVPQDYYGYGGYFIGGYQGVRGEVVPVGSGVYYGVYGYVSGGSGSNYAVRGYSYGAGNNYAIRGAASGATGSTGSNYGVYASASGTGTNYGIYSSGGDYAIYASGNISYTGNLTKVSDEKFKQNVQPVTGVISKIMRLELKQFEFISNKEYSDMNFASGRQYGFIAQELEKVFPELVVDVVHPQADEEDGERGKPIHYKGINYVELIPILLQAIKEQQQSIDSLKIEISRQKE